MKPRGQGISFCKPKEIEKIMQAFPVFEDANQQRYYEPLKHQQLKDLAESVRTYGINASFTQAQVDRLAYMAMTPTDWYSTIRACLSMGQYLDWKSIFQDACTAQARNNALQGQPHWDYDMLTGQGQWSVNQTAFPVQVYEQINKLAVKAWKSLPNKGEVSGNLTKVIQGPTEPFSDFVARMMEAAGRIFGDAEAAMPLVEQLIFEQCTKECRNAITPWKGKGLNAWMKACREIGGPLTNSGIAAAVLAAQRSRDVTCFNCGRKGHIRRQCKQSNRMNSPRKVPDICPKCGKGRHWANECRSVKDIKGKIISRNAGEPPKNGQKGPCPQGPQMYGAFQSRGISLRPPTSQGEPLQVRRDWTSVPPPGQY
ncbi:igE-binding protein-like [Fukomys damarensis]|uniref:igE-binding protein-like n=1 Tax=Fukomys damarensis TaxID=885580 RepID=UPI00145537EF|nr:igE-binding protein-like [Fukomys damarensis]